MSGRIPQYFIDDLLARVDIVDLIDRYVPLKKTGSNYMARCPFHTEKTPSFSVNRTKQIFHCFGCGVSGNAISFLMDFSHLNFVEAIEDLAAFAGVEVPRETAGQQTPSHRPKEDLANNYQLLEQTAKFYNTILNNPGQGKKASDYLAQRGVTEAISQRFMLGYAPDDWRTLTNRFDQARLIATGMAVSKETKIYDRFRDRLMFPIRDKRGRVAGFGGRVMDDSLPKYLNSPETPIFHKNKEVYGLHELLQKNAKPDRILVVEGYMDVIALACNGLDYAVATLGTAVSQTHMDLLFRFTSELVFCFDGDSAGQKAAWRAISAVFPSLKDGRQIRLMILPEKHDPDSLINEVGLSQFEERIHSSQALSTYFFEHFSKDLNLAEFEDRSSLKTEAESYLKLLPIGAFRELMFDELSKLYRKHVLDEEAILAYQQQIKSQRQKNEMLSLPSFIMALLVQNPRFIEEIDHAEIDWEILEFEGAEKFKSILSFIMQHKPNNHGVLLEHYRDHPDARIIRKLASYDFLIPEEELKVRFADAVNRLMLQTVNTRLEKLLSKDKKQGLDKNEKETLRKLLSHPHNSA